VGYQQHLEREACQGQDEAEEVEDVPGVPPVPPPQGIELDAEVSEIDDAEEDISEEPQDLLELLLLRGQLLHEDRGEVRDDDDRER